MYYTLPHTRSLTIYAGEQGGEAMLFSAEGKKRIIFHLKLLGIHALLEFLFEQNRKFKAWRNS